MRFWCCGGTPFASGERAPTTLRHNVNRCTAVPQRAPRLR
jgi:hypothetical protein